jgi:hypothetical protein
LRREEEVVDTSDGGGQDSEEEEEQEQELEQEEEQDEEEEGHYEVEARHYEDKVVGVMDLLQDPHPHADIGLATSFALLKHLTMRTGLSLSLLAMRESFILLCFVFN